MNNEIQLSPSSNVPAPTPWGGGNALVHTPQANQTGLQRVHQLLRGRYGVALLLAALFATTGAVAGFLVPRPSYQSTGLIEIKPVTDSPTQEWDRVMPMYQYYVSSVVQKITTDRAVNLAMKDRRWRTHRPDSPAALAEFKRGLQARYVPGTTLIQVTYTSDAKDAKDFCQDAMTSLINAYENSYTDLSEADFKNREGHLVTNLGGLKAEISAIQDDIAKLTQSVGEDPQISIQTLQREQAVSERELMEANNTLAAAAIALKQAHTYSVDELAQVDPVLNAMVQRKIQQESLLSNLALQYGPAHPNYRSMKKELDLIDAQIKDAVARDNAEYFIKQKPDATGGVLIKRNLDELTTWRDQKQKNFNQFQEKIEEDQAISNKLREKRKALEEKQDEVVALKKKIQEVDDTHDIAKTFSVVDAGTQATPANDRRVAFGALGFLAGGGLPIGLMLLAGLMNPRVRYSDDTSKEVSGLTLLGILPDLPDRLSDPEQASIAAHCVHQIRTMLQINNHTQDRRVFALTSASPGDGKTSLTLALGLSYAACGTRTLLIDCDLVGAGLTTRMNVNVPEGVLEAISNRTLLEYVRTTDVADVAILPVGTSQSLHASTLSPAALRRLVDEAKKHFETVLIDTGPILGSIEASLVCAAADAVVLCVARGQQRPLVERAISHLHAIGAHLAGVVFNRAQSSDFDRSISGMSVRSSTASGNGGRYGPVARAVQNGYKR